MVSPLHFDQNTQSFAVQYSSNTALILRQTTQLRIIINAKLGEASQGCLSHYEGAAANKIIYDSHLLTGARREFCQEKHCQGMYGRTYPAQPSQVSPQRQADQPALIV